MHNLVMVECRVYLLLRWLALMLACHNLMMRLLLLISRVTVMRQLALSAVLLRQELLSLQGLLCLTRCVLERTHPVRLCLLLLLYRMLL